MNKQKFLGYTLTESATHIETWKNNCKHAFTLAEVLVALGIIGVIAAMTLPSVIKHYQQQATVSKLKKFYTNINQAVKLSEAENGACNTWNKINSDKEFYDIYLSKYVKTLNIKRMNIPTTSSDSSVLEYRYIFMLSDGSGFALSGYNPGISTRLTLIYFYPQIKNIQSTNFNKDRFMFQLYTSNCIVRPYSNDWSGTRNALINNYLYGCKNSKQKHYCAKLIEYDGWKMSKDYPW